MTTTHAEPRTPAPPPAPADNDLGRAMPALAWDEAPPAPTAGGEYLPPDALFDYQRAVAARSDAAGASRTPAGVGGLARGLLADLIEAARDAELLADALEARDLTASEAAAVLAAERPGLPFRLMETATEVCGFPAFVGAESGRTCSACVYPAGGRMRAFHGTAWRAVVSDVLAACGAEAGGQ